MVRVERERHLDWAGCLNARDLGGLPTGDGRTTRWRAVVRADNLDRLAPEGWAAPHAYGVRTVVDLREGDERSTVVTRTASRWCTCRWTTTRMPSSGRGSSTRTIAGALRNRIQAEPGTA